MRTIFRSCLLLTLTVLAPVILMLRPANVDAQTVSKKTEQDKMNNWTVGLAGGLLEGAPLRLAAEMARIVDDGSNLHVLPIVTRGATENLNSLLYLRGVDTAIEAVGIPATFELCESIVAPGGIVANIGVHGVKVALHLEQLWDRNITITTRLVDAASTQMLLDVVRARKIDPKRLITHRFKLDQIDAAYHTFGHASDQRALKVLVEASA